MKTSTDRILTTHVGSLARPEPLLRTMREKAHGRAYDPDVFARQVREAVFDRVARQRDCGIDVVTDGEQGKVSFFTYVVERLTGFSTVEGTKILPPSWQLEIDAFPDYYERYFDKYTETVTPLTTTECIGPVEYKGHDQVQADIDNLTAAVATFGAEDAFLCATSPRGFGENRYYRSDRDYLEAVAEALSHEYRAITDAGLVLQIDDPWLVEILTGDGRTPWEERARAAHEHIDILNHALRDIAPEHVRLHVCYGLNHGPRVHDLPLADIAPFMLRVDAGAYSFEVANPRHQHEWRVWEEFDLPDDKVLLPGLLSHGTAYVEHPRLIADMIETYARLVGHERVIASADCGFSSRATYAPEIPASVVWAKFEALSRGARLASADLCDRPDSYTS